MARQYNNAIAPVVTEIPRPAIPMPGPVDIIAFKFWAMFLTIFGGSIIASASVGLILWYFWRISVYLWVGGVIVVSVGGLFYGGWRAGKWLHNEALPNLPHFPPPAVEVREVPSIPARGAPDRIIFTNNPLSPPVPKEQPAPVILPPDGPKTRLLNGCREDDLLYVAECIINTGDSTQRTFDGKMLPSGPCTKEYHSQLCTTLQDHLKVMAGFAPRQAGRMLVDDMDTVRSQMNLVLTKRYR